MSAKLRRWLYGNEVPLGTGAGSARGAVGSTGRVCTASPPGEVTPEKAGLSASYEETRFKDVGVNYRIRTDAPREEVEELCDYVKRKSPVSDIITSGVPVDIALE